MKVYEASTRISAEFGGIRDSCLDIYHLILQGVYQSNFGIGICNPCHDITEYRPCTSGWAATTSMTDFP